MNHLLNKQLKLRKVIKKMIKNKIKERKSHNYILILINNNIDSNNIIYKLIFLVVF